MMSKKKFKLLAGTHVVDDAASVCAVAGDVIVSGDDLVALWGREKFALVGDAEDAKPSEDSGEDAGSKKKASK